MSSKYLLVALLCVATAATAHEHHAPHQGTLVELGEEAAHIELVLDAKIGTLTAYVLDGEAERPVRIRAPKLLLKARLPGECALELVAIANPLTGESEGDTSEFRVQSNALRGVTRFDGVIPRVTVRGVAFENVSIRFPGGRP